MKLLAIVLIAWVFNLYALEMSDYVPGFLLPSQDYPESADVPVKALVDVKRNSSSTRGWYCNRNQDNVGNVFCKNDTDEVVKSLTYESDPMADKTKVRDNAVSGTKFGQNTSSNQNTLQNQDLKNNLQKSQGGFMVPIAPSKDVNMNINQQQIQSNIKY